MPTPELPTVDVDLQDLYDQVLSGFNDDAFPELPTPVAQNKASPSDLESLYSSYAEDTTDPSSKLSRNLSYTVASQPVSAQRSTSVQSQGQTQRRQLPPIPGNSSSSRTSSTYGMPEPRPYHDPSRSHDPSRPPFNGPNGYYNGGGPTKDYFSVDPRVSHHSHLSSTLRPNSSRSTASPSVPHSPLYLQDDAETHAVNSTRPTLPSKVPMQSAKITHMPEPAFPTEDLSASYPDPGGSNGANLSIYRNDSAGSYVLPPLPHQAYSPGQLVNPHTDSPSYVENVTLSRGPSVSTSGFSHANVDRNNSITSNNTGGEPIVIGPSSSVATSVYREDSAVSRVSSLPQEYMDIKMPVPLEEEYPQEQYPDAEYAEDEELYTDSEDESMFVNFALLSHLAVRLRDRVPRGTHVKGSIPYPRAFTGKDIVSTIQAQIQRELLINHGISTNDRRAALEVARSLQSQLFFYEVEWGGRALTDGVEDVYMFLDDQEGGSDARIEMEELPTGVVTYLTKCYTPCCVDGHPCYAYSCPRRGQSASILSAAIVEAPAPRASIKSIEWQEGVPPEILASLPESEVKRQTIIRKVISKEQQYIKDLDFIEEVFIRPLRSANPPVIQGGAHDFIEEVFGNILDLRECNRNLLETMYVRQREQGEVVSKIGDIFLNAATEFRFAYPTYMGQLPGAEKRLKEEMEANGELRVFLEQCVRHPDNVVKMDLKVWLNRPSEHLQKYPVVFEAIRAETAEGNPDVDFLKEAIEAMRNLQSIAQLKSFQMAMGKGPASKFEWHTLVPEDVRNGIPKQVAKRQAVIFELIKGEMAYVKDLENIEYMYVRPLRSMDPSIIAGDRLDIFIRDVFHNFGELHAHHKRLLDQFFEIQREEHPIIRSVTAAMYDAVLNFREAYLEYIPNYPIAAYRIDDEMENNPQFKTFVDQCVRHADAHRLDMKNFINRPIPRLLRYELLLKNILEETPAGHEDLDTIPAVLDVIKGLGKETEPGVVSAKQKVELWRYNANLVFKVGENIDMDLLNENRSLIHTGKFLRQPDTGFEWSGWTELFVLLFDNYLVMTKPKEKDGVTKYQVYRRPIPLDLLTLATFTDPPTQRGGRLLPFGGRRDTEGPNPAVSPPGASPEAVNDARAVYPCTIHHNGRLGGLYTLYAESAQARLEWKAKMDEAIGLRKVVQESNKVFEVETLSVDTFFAPTLMANAGPAWNNDGNFTGKVTCSVPFTTPDGRGLVAIGCSEGVWIGFRHDSRSMRRVLHLRMVSQCAMLEDFGIFLVLADKSLFAYHIEALVPSSPGAANSSQTPQKLSGNKDVQFFTVGNLSGRTLVIYMKKKNLDSVFRVLEPVIGKINEKTKAQPSIGSRFGLRSQRSEWFRVYRDFFLPSDSYDLLFLKARIVILCSKGFEIMDLSDFKSVTIPQREDPRLEKLAKRCESCRPMGMFRSNKDEFLLCYDEFGLYVDKHGDPSHRMGTIEWEGTAERVAWHPPYILLFDSRFIEIRHVETGRLVQVISGNDIRCIWDGRGTNHSQAVSEGTWDEIVSQEPRVHGVMNMDTPQPGRRGVTAQHVFELIPTVPLFLPGSLASPSHASYFNQSNSPPHSPKLNPAYSFSSR